MNWLDYKSIITTCSKKVHPDAHCVDDVDMYQRRANFSVLIESKHPSQYTYNFIINRNWEDTLRPHFFRFFWDHNMDKIDNIFLLTDYRNLFKDVYRITNVTKLRDFQYRLLLGKIFLNHMLYKWKIVDTPNCPLCTVQQTLIHFFWECKHAKLIWDTLCDFAKNRAVELEFNYFNVITNKVHKNVNNIFNFIVLIFKQSMFRHKCANMQFTFDSLLNEARHMYRIELYNAWSKEKIQKINMKWAEFVSFNE